MKHDLSILVLCLGVLLLIPAGADADEGAEGTPAPPPAAGTMRFSASPEAFPVTAKPVFTTGQTVYALVGFGGPWRESMKQATGKTSVVAMLLEGDRVLARSTFFPGERGFEATTFVLEVLPDPDQTTQYNHAFARTLAGLPVGTHQLQVKLWSMYGKKDPLALSAFTFEVTGQAWELLRRVSEKIKEAQKNLAPPLPPPQPAATLVKVRHDGADFLQLRGDEIVKDGAVVGTFDKNVVRRDGSIMGEIRGEVFRHEGAEVWKLDKGNLYAGTEVRLEGAVIGSLEASGRITLQGSEWGDAKPFAGKPAEAMRIFAALYYFSDYFTRSGG